MKYPHEANRTLAGIALGTLIGLGVSITLISMSYRLWPQKSVLTVLTPIIIPSADFARATHNRGPLDPVRLRIPSIGIDAPMLTVGLLRGAIDTPCDPEVWNQPPSPCINNTAWYRGSVRPGEPGNAIIDAHVDWYHLPYGTGAVPAVFAHLNRAKIGDRVTVIDVRGKVRTFIVDGIESVPYPGEPAGFFATTGTSTVTLVTCDGIYVNATTGMARRLYIHATMEGT